MRNDKPAPWDARLTDALGSLPAIFVVLAIIGIWGLSGPLLGFSDTWQLIINTSTTIVTCVVGFIILRTQNRDTKAIHAKLDTLIYGVPEADDTVAGIEREPKAAL
jgi:low affinity Fe/Cu permease